MQTKYSCESLIGPTFLVSLSSPFFLSFFISLFLKMNRLEQIALDPRFHEALSVLKGFRNGVVYGAKVRFPHALVMTILFKTGS